MTGHGKPLDLDASAALDLLLQLRSARKIGALVAGPFAAVHVPETIDREVMNVLRKKERMGMLSREAVMRRWKSSRTSLSRSTPRVPSFAGGGD